MKRFFLFFLMLFCIPLYASDVDMLEKMRSEVVSQLVKEPEPCVTEVNMPEEPPLLDIQRIISVSVTYRACMAQGNTYDECQLLQRDRSNYIDDYRAGNYRQPTLEEAAEDFFFNINIRN